MKLTLKRISGGKHDTIGKLFVDGKFICYTLEDEHRIDKVKHETRIPSGIYRITFRKEGGFNSRYAKKYGEEFHKGMLWLRDVPNFEYILIHTGNNDSHTSGCILTGSNVFNIDKTEERRSVGNSVRAYKKLYPIVSKALSVKDPVYIEVIDEK